MKNFFLRLFRWHVAPRFNVLDLVTITAFHQMCSSGHPVAGTIVLANGIVLSRLLEIRSGVGHVVIFPQARASGVRKP